MFGLVQLLHATHVETTIGKMVFLAKYAFSKSNPLTTTVSFSALAALITIRWIKTKIPHIRWFYRLPEVLLVVVVSTFLSFHFHWHERGLDILGAVDIQTGDRFIEFPLSKYTLKYLHRTTSTAALIAVVGFLDSIVAAKQNAARFGYSISPNRELVALGAANLAGSFVPATLPAFGSITRSRINGDVGGRSQMASLVCSGLILLATFFLLPLLYCLPKCVLAAMYFLPLFYFHCLIEIASVGLVVFSLLAEAPHDVVYYWHMKAWVDFSVMSLTFVFSIVWDIQVGVVFGLLISLLLVVHRSSKTRMTILVCTFWL